MFSKELQSFWVASRVEAVSESGNAVLFAVQLQSPVTAPEETAPGVLWRSAAISLQSPVENDR